MIAVDSASPAYDLNIMKNKHFEKTGIRMQKDIKVAIVGVGNCASALVQGVEYYRSRNGVELDGIMRHSIGGYSSSAVEFVAAFDRTGRLYAVLASIGSPLALRRGDLPKFEG